MSTPAPVQQAGPTALDPSAKEMWKNAVQSLYAFDNQLMNDLYHALWEEDLPLSTQQETLLKAMGYHPTTGDLQTRYHPWTKVVYLATERVKLGSSLEQDREGDKVSCGLLRDHHARFGNVIHTIEGSIETQDRPATTEGSSTLLQSLVKLWKAFDEHFNVWNEHQRAQGNETADEADSNSLKTLTAEESKAFWTEFPWPRGSVPHTRASYSGGEPSAATNTQLSISLAQYQQTLQSLAEEQRTALGKHSNLSQMEAITELLSHPGAGSGGGTARPDDSAYCSRAGSTAPTPVVSRRPSPDNTIVGMSDMAPNSTIDGMRAGFCNGWPAYK